MNSDIHQSAAQQPVEPDGACAPQVNGKALAARTILKVV
jgi:hypothetical protein